MDTFLLENSIWKVILSNNEVILSDNQYIDNKSDWERLKEYCLVNSFNIKEMYIIFRDNIKKISEGKHYYFRRMSLSRFGKIDRPENTYQYFIVGSTNDPSKITVTKYLVPELAVWQEEERILEQFEESLI